ncbi:MAG: osmY [Nitrospira sp.]|jgi:osmotically-inducible protein OsmY|nr:osmY [Nitrospira sp.]
MNGILLHKRIFQPTLILIGAALALTSGQGAVGISMAGAYLGPSAMPTDAAHGRALQRVKDDVPAADGTGRNAQDRETPTMTPLDQSNDPADVKITQKIRKALVADDALSTTAKNIKIITVHGKVILRGPVATVREKKKIGKTAQKFTKQLVDNQLEVAARH